MSPAAAGPLASVWVRPYSLCDFCRRRLPDDSAAAYRRHLKTCREYLAFALNPEQWYREYWRISGHAAMRLHRIAGRPDLGRPARILSPAAGPYNVWGTLYRGVFPAPDLARSYGAWRLRRKADGYHRDAVAFDESDDVVDDVGSLWEARILALPRAETPLIPLEEDPCAPTAPRPPAPSRPTPGARRSPPARTGP